MLRRNGQCLSSTGVWQWIKWRYFFSVENVDSGIERPNLANYKAARILTVSFRLDAIANGTSVSWATGAELDTENRGLNKYWFVQHDYTKTAFFLCSIEAYLAAAKDAKEKQDLYSNSDETFQTTADQVKMKKRQTAFANSSAKCAAA